MDMQILEDIGLSKAEIKTYISLLELGPTTSGPLIQHSKLQSSVVHRVLKTLIEKGIVTYIKIGKNKQYQATDPKNMLEFLDNKKKRFIDILPTLEAKQQQNNKNYATEMFVGKKAIFATLLNTIQDAKKYEEYLSFSLIEPHQDEEIIRFYKNYNLRRKEKKLRVKVLVNKKVKKIFEENYDKKILKLANVRYTNFHFPQGIVIFRDTLTFVNWKDNPFAVKITNETMANEFKIFFEEFYEKEKDAY
ncbi:MAG: TrmB family transcriptional regulator [Candidatus Woesearchaeota archaeon]